MAQVLGPYYSAYGGHQGRIVAEIAAKPHWLSTPPAQSRRILMPTGAHAGGHG
jgi:hypothetical protein